MNQIRYKRCTIEKNETGKVLMRIATKNKSIVKYKCHLFVCLILCAMQLFPRIVCEQIEKIFKRSIDTTEKVPRLGKKSD